MSSLPGAVNPCDFLYKLASQRAMPPPTFDQVSESGPPHMKIYIWQGTFFGITAQGQGRSKKEARVAAAKAIKASINETELPAPAKTYQDVMMEKKRKKPEAGMESKAKKKYDYKRHQQQQMMMMQHPMMGGFNPDPFGPPQNPFGMPPREAYFVDEWGAPGTMAPAPGAAGVDVDHPAFKMGPPDPEYMMPGPMGYAGPFGPPMRFGPPMMMGGFFPPPPPPRFKRADYHVIEKHKAIYPKEEVLSAILRVADRTQAALEKATVTLDKADDFDNKLLGGAKVGALAKGLLLSTDASVNLVVMCRDFPTRTQLKRLFVETEKELKEVVAKKEEVVEEKEDKKKAEGKEEPDAKNGRSSGEEANFIVSLMEDEGGFSVTSSVRKEGVQTSYTAVVTMSSTTVRAGEGAAAAKKESKDGEPEEDGKNGGDEEMEAEEESPDKVADRLPKKSCLRALSDIRHAKWFEARAGCLTSCVECIRVVKEMARREAAWAALTDWAIELLVQKALETANTEMTPSKSLMRVLEVVSSGIFIPGFGPGLMDPCERGSVSAAPDMDRVQAEALTSTAQLFLRMLHFNKIHIVLAIDPLPRKTGWKTNKAADDKKENENAVAAPVAPAASEAATEADGGMLQ